MRRFGYVFSSVSRCKPNGGCHCNPPPAPVAGFAHLPYWSTVVTGCSCQAVHCQARHPVLQRPMLHARGQWALGARGTRGGHPPLWPARTHSHHLLWRPPEYLELGSLYACITQARVGRLREYVHARTPGNTRRRARCKDASPPWCGPETLRTLGRK